MRESFAPSPRAALGAIRAPRLALTLGLAAALAGPLTACPTPPTTQGPGDAEDVALDGQPDGGAWDTPADGALGPDGGQPRGAQRPCANDADCAALPSDGCGRWTCVQGTCADSPLPDGSACDWGLCVDQGVCSGGECAPAMNACDDGNPCTTDQCDPASGCVHTFNQLPCDDEDACTTGDACSKGTCRGAPVVCDDGESCTEDACDPATGTCTFAPRLGDCDDGDACTVGDRCVSGQCEPGEPLDCDDGEACTEEHCEPEVGCVTAPLTGPCDDGNACTVDTNCSDGQCLGTLITCDDGEICTSDYCDPTAGCVFQPNAVACDDGDPCTLDDTCDDGVCVPGAVDPLCCDVDEACDDEDLCTTDACVDGYCSFTPLDCDDGAACTVDTCHDGICTHEPLGALGDGPLWSDGFEEASLDGWEILSDNADVTWQLDPSRAHDGGASLYCGNLAAQTYDFGETRAEATREVFLPAVSDLALHLWAWLDVTEPSCTYDYATVTVNGGALEPPLCETTDGWAEFTFDLTPWAGQSITLGLVFATTDNIANDGQGVWIDDVTITGQGPTGCCAHDADCLGGSGCLAEVCSPTDWTCGVPDPADACQDGDPCTEDLCDDTGACQHPLSGACCTVATDCQADPDQPCATPSCGPDGLCTLDDSLCCAGDGAACPPHALGDCAVASCSPSGTCEYDTSGCPTGG